MARGSTPCVPCRPSIAPSGIATCVISFAETAKFAAKPMPGISTAPWVARIPVTNRVSLVLSSTKLSSNAIQKSRP